MQPPDPYRRGYDPALGERARKRFKAYQPPPVSPARARFHDIWDAIIIIVVCLSLGLILFDTLYRWTALPALLEALSPSLNAAGGWLSANATRIDLIFVAIFVIDLIGGWTMAILERRYHRWFFYPFVHWYDVLGSLPIAGLRFLRILRVIGLVARLQRRGVIEIRDWRIYRFFNKYYQVALEELADRIAIKLMTSAQEEIRLGDSLPKRMIDEVLAPRRDVLVGVISERLNGLVAFARDRHRGDLERYLISSTRKVLDENPRLRTLKGLPFGDHLARSLESSLIDVIQRLVRDSNQALSSDQFQHATERLVGDVFDRALADPALSDGRLEETLIDVLEVLKDEIQLQRWKERYG
ncbi:ion transporter [Halotalea alkalilenta]|uniref:Preprotein translocase subunit SecA n=1 Tax=Halotalea alkalilenta TaxID=376489 RepID=A0A172YIY2_9GAMM|nr:ion transporter [Halotalea alkalilenta]ANF59177.1 hypothetical protein A5892_18335 [Halotalea alkalilenta]